MLGVLGWGKCPHSQPCGPVLVHLCVQKVLAGRDWAVGSGLRSASSPSLLPPKPLLQPLETK